MSTMAESTRVQAERKRHMNEHWFILWAFFKIRLLCEEHAWRFTRRTRNGRSNARRFFGAVLTIFWFILLSLNLFLSLRKFDCRWLLLLSQQLYTRVLLSVDGYQTVLKSGFKYSETITEKKCFSDTIYVSKFVISFFVVLVIIGHNFFYPNFLIRIFPSASAIR